MSNNNVPTGPGFWYRQLEFGIEPVKVRADSIGRLLYMEAGLLWNLPVHDDGLWAGPVPMPGEFVLIPKQPERKPDGHMRSFAFQVNKDADGNYVATDLPPMEPIYEPDKWYSFTWDRETGEMTPRDDDKPEEPR